MLTAKQMVAIIIVITPKLEQLHQHYQVSSASSIDMKQRRIFLELRAGKFGKCAGGGKCVMGTGES